MRIHPSWSCWPAGRLYFALDLKLRLYCFDLDRDFMLIWKSEEPVAEYHDANQNVSISCDEIRRWDRVSRHAGERDVGVMQVSIILLGDSNLLVSLTLSVEYLPTNSCEEILLGEIGMKVHQLDTTGADYPDLYNVTSYGKWAIYSHRDGLNVLDMKLSKTYYCPLPTGAAEMCAAMSIGIIEGRYFYFVYVVTNPFAEQFVIYPLPGSQATKETFKPVVHAQIYPMVVDVMHIREEAGDAFRFHAALDDNDEDIILAFPIPPSGATELVLEGGSAYSSKRLPVRSSAIVSVSLVSGKGSHLVCHPHFQSKSWRLGGPTRRTLALVPIRPAERAAAGSDGFEFGEITWLRAPLPATNNVCYRIAFDDVQGRLFSRQLNEIRLVRYV